MSWRWFLIALAATVSGCSRAPQPATPAIWHVTGPDHQEAWLFGTIHAAPKPLAWNTPPVARALARADEILVEVANIADDAAVAQAFSALARTPGLPPVSRRIPPPLRRALHVMLAERGIAENDLRDVETWAVALTLARPASGSDARNGIDRAVLATAGDKRVIELEGATAQLSIFDRLPEAEQRDLLGAVLSDTGALDDDAELVNIWRRGDMARIEAETRTGLLADAELRAALFTDRNRAWTNRIAAEMRVGHKPFVAVGAAHMASPDGLIKMLERQGYQVSRADQQP